jgi:predicted ATPase
MKTNNLNKLTLHTLSGFEGVGKSTIINHYQNKLDYYIIPETARLIIPLEDNVLEDSRDDLSYKSFISYLTNIHFLLSNNIHINCISDRNIIDSLVYLQLYSKDQKIDINKLGDFIERFLETHQREYFYDNTFLIKHPKDEEYILQNILSDPERKYGINPKQYMHDATIWEDIYLSIAHKLKQRSLFKNIILLDSYPENKQIITDIVKNTER